MIRRMGTVVNPTFQVEEVSACSGEATPRKNAFAKRIMEAMTFCSSFVGNDGVIAVPDQISFRKIDKTTMHEPG